MRKRRIHKLQDDICPLHGDMGLLPGNWLAWQIWSRYDFFQIQPIPGQKPYVRLDYAALQAIFEIELIEVEDQAECLEKLQLIFDEHVKQH